MMKLNDLMGLITIALEENNEDFNTWFIRFSGHVNKLEIDFWRTGWETDKQYLKEECSVKLDENGIQEAYWFINNRLKK